MGAFRFKQFEIDDTLSAMKVGTDSVLLGCWTDVSPLGPGSRVLDAGAGCGLLSLMMAQRCDAAITAVEIDPDACTQCIDNVAASPWPCRVTTVEADMLSFRPQQPCDLIISNPPFYGEELHAPDARRALARHGEGFDVISLVEAAPSLLSPDGSLAFVAPVNRRDEIDFALALAGLHVNRRASVRQRPSRPVSRLLYQASLRPSAVAAEEITIGGERYFDLTRDFYLYLQNHETDHAN